MLSPQLSPQAVRALLAELARIPDDRLPGDTRAALAEAIRSGEVDALYQPAASRDWNVCPSRLPRDIDPRIPLAQWVEWWQAGKSPSDETVRAQRANQAQALAVYLAQQAAQADGEARS